MKDNNRETIIHFEMSNQEYAPVKNAISEELKAVISKVYQLDHETGWTLHYLTDIMLNHLLLLMTLKTLTPPKWQVMLSLVICLGLITRQ